MQGNINIPDSNITTSLTFRQLVLMNMQQLTNFPYIEKDFDALTDYELLCLVVKYLNDVISNQNEQNDSITRMYESFLALQEYVNNTKDEIEDAFNELDNYVRNYFDNLDVQEEINNKLDKMVEDGTLQEIIASYLNSKAIFAFDSVDDMKQSTNLIDGSYAKTLGKENINDGESVLYKISENPIEGLNNIQLENGLYANEINNFNDNYYDEINFTQGRANDTDYYIIEVPLNDKFNNIIPLRVAKSTSDSPLIYAQKNHTNLTINAGLTKKNSQNEWKQSIVIGNGEVLHGITPDITFDEDNVYIGFTENRELLEFKANITTVEDMINAGIKNAYLVFYRYLNNGVIETHENNPSWNETNPRMDIGIKENGNLIIFACDGRTINNKGMNDIEASQLMSNLGCVKAWRTDGGGSTSLNYKSNKINRNIDSHGTSDRMIEYTLNIFKDIKNKKMSEKYSFDSEMKHLLNKQIRDDLHNDVSSIFLAVNSNSRNNIVTASTYQLVDLDGIYRHNNRILPLIEDNKRTGFRLMSSGMFLIRFVVNLDTKTSGDKTIKITKGDDNTMVAFTHVDVSLTTNQTGNYTNKQLSVEYVVNNPTETELQIRLWIKGNSAEDRFQRMTAYAEYLGSAA